MKQIILLVLILMYGCKQRLPSVPSEIIPMQTMIQVFTEIHIAEAVAETKAQKGEQENKLTLQYHTQILKNFNIKSEDFAKSFKFYEENPILMDEMYAKVLVETSKRAAKVANDK